MKFNRRGMVGMAKGTGVGGYGSQFFITLGDCRAELDGKCTMFGRVEGDGIYNVVKIAETDLIEGSERPMYPEKILKAEIVELPKGDAWQKMRRRIKVAERVVEAPVKKKVPKKLIGEEKRAVGRIGREIWKSYFMACGGKFYWMLFVFAFTANGMGPVFEKGWLR